MKISKMKKIIIFIFILCYPVLGFANTEYCKTDIYYANGIDTKREDAIINARILAIATQKFYGMEEYENRIGKVSYAYNETNGFLLDGLETFLRTRR